jgi:hypothetical protein
MSIVTFTGYIVECEYDLDGCEGQYSTIRADGPWSAKTEAVEAGKWVQIGGVLGKDACPNCAPRALAANAEKDTLT